MSAPLEILALIPARAGSRRLPGKNLLPLAGRPLLAWTIEAATASTAVTRVVVSTEDDAIAACARGLGAEVPTIRPAALAQHDTPGMEPITHMVHWLADVEAYRPAIVVVLQPTSPLRTAADIDDCLGLMQRRGAEAVASVYLAPFPMAWVRHIDADGMLSDPGVSHGPAHVLNGAIYAATAAVVHERKSMYAESTLAYVMPADRSVDIDEPFDLELAEFLLARRRHP